MTVIGPLTRGDAPAGTRGFGGVVNVPANGAANHMALFPAPWAMRRFFRQHDFDVVHVHEPFVPALAYYALWLSPAAGHVATFHMYAETEARAWKVARRGMAALLRPSIHCAIAVSRPAQAFARQAWRGRLTIIPNGVPLSVFGASDPDASPAPATSLRLLFVGNWRDPRKGLSHLIEAYRRLRREGLAVTLDVAGAGPPEPPEPIEGVRFHGAISDEHRLARRYEECDVFVSPAMGQESFGIVLLEAMAAGRPIVCSAIDGYREVAGPEGARFVAPGDASALAEAIRTLAGDAPLRRRMGAFNRRAVARYDWDVVADAVRKQYVRAVTARRRMARRRRYPLASMVLLAIVLAGMLAGGRTAQARAGSLLPTPLTFLRQDAGLSEGDVNSMGKGRVIARVLDGDPSEVFTVGAMRVRTDAAHVLQQLRQFEGRRRPGDILQAGRLGKETSVHDLEPLRLDGSDLSALSSCKPYDCDERLPSSAINRFRTEVPWSSPQRADKASALWRETLAGFASTYMARGNGGLPEYDNNDMPVKAGDSINRVIAESGYIADSAPELYRYLSTVPKDPAPGLEEYLYWVKEKFWIKTVVSMSHVMIQTGQRDAAPFVIAVSKQFYANRYFESSLSATVFVEDPSGGLLVYVSRSRADIRPTGFTFLERLVLRRLVSGRLESQLRLMRTALESPAKSP